MAPKKNAPQGTFTHSTPQQNKLICKYCSKVYQVKFFFDQHVASHESASTRSNTTDLNASVAIQLDDSIVSVPNTSFRVPTAPAKKNITWKKPKVKPKYVCTYCLKGYICQRSFKSHCRMHQIEDAAARYPDKRKFLDNCENLATAALKKVMEAPSCGDNGILFRQLIGYIVSIPKEDWKKFAEALSEEILKEILMKKILLPSALLVTLFTSVESVLSDTDLCNNLLKILTIPFDLCGNISSQFYLEFVLQFAQVCLSFLCNEFRAGRMPIQKAPIVLDADDRQVIYYISGSVMRGYVRMAYRYNSSSWVKIARIVKEKVLRVKPTPEDDEDAQWTLHRDRGGLLYVTVEAKNFISLTEVVFRSEQKKGSLDYEGVIKQVSDSKLSDQWDSIIGDALNERTSLNLMTDVITSYCRTCGSGFVKRRLNFLKEKPVISMPTRHAVARRKK